MKNKRGFTLVEILAVILILGTISILVITTINNSSAKAKEKLLETKKNTAIQGLILWAQNNRTCFLNDASNNNECIIGLNKDEGDCVYTGEKNLLLSCSTTYVNLAENNIIKYDNKDSKLVINPINNSSMNDVNVTIYYDQANKVFLDKEPRQVIVKRERAQEPGIEVLPEQDQIWSSTKLINIIYYSGIDYFKTGGTLQYGWSVSKKEEPITYKSYPLNYGDNENEISLSINDNRVNEKDLLNGKYYLWLKTTLETTGGYKFKKEVFGEYFFDNEPPSTPKMTMVYVDSNDNNKWKTYQGTWETSNNFVGKWTSNNIYVVQAVGQSGGCTSTTGGPTVGNINDQVTKYKISSDNTIWEEYKYDCNKAMYRLNLDTTSSNKNERYIVACDRADNCSEPVKLIARIDKSVPSVSINAKKSTSNTIVRSGNWSDETLKYTLTATNVGLSNATIYYCKYTGNTPCTNWTTEAVSNNGVVNFSYNDTGEYYIRYKIVSGAGKESNVLSEKNQIHVKSHITKKTVDRENQAKENRLRTYCFI